MGRHRRALANLHSRAGGRGIQRRKALAERIVYQRLGLGSVLRIALAPQRLVDIDMLFQGERRIQYGFDPLHAVLLDRLLDLPRVVGRVLDDVLAHLPLAAAEHQVVAGEVGMAQHVGRDQYVLGEPVAGGQVGMARVAREHDLEQARVAHVPLYELVDVPHSERPVRHPHRQSVDRDLHHERVRNRFEFDRMEFEPRARGKLLDALCITLPVGCHVLRATSIGIMRHPAPWLRR